MQIKLTKEAIRENQRQIMRMMDTNLYRNEELELQLIFLDKCRAELNQANGELREHDN